MTAETPLVWTAKGNLPIADLHYSTEWVVEEAFIKFTETHRDASGEVVKQSVHVYDRIGADIGAQAATI